MAANFRRLVQLRAALAEEESRRAEARLRLEELGRDKERLERSLQRAAGETERRITRLQTEYEAQVGQGCCTFRDWTGLCNFRG